ncbi:WecB/TagA/CpsF family glycosyltransferase [Patescibacteria group bacterium]
MNTKFTLLGVNIDILSKTEVDDRLRSFILSSSSHHIVTLNPEIVMWAQKDEEYKSILHNASLTTADGIGIVVAGKLKGHTISRFTGYDLTMNILHIAEEEHASVFLLGDDSHVAHFAGHKIKKQFPLLKIVGAEAGPRIKLRNKKMFVDLEEREYLIEHINMLKPDILLVAFGHPKQEKWIADVLSELHSVRIAVGIGGVLDYLSGKIQRAPRIFRAIGLEWLFRLFRQPWRFPRIVTATVRFMIALIKEPKIDKS